MRQYEYEITKHANEDFTHLVYVCNAEGECSIDQVPENQINMLTDMLTEGAPRDGRLYKLFLGGTELLFSGKEK